MACLYNCCRSGNGIVHSVCIFELDITVRHTKILSVVQQCFYGEIMSPGPIKTFLGLRVKCAMFLSNCNQIWSFAIDIYKSQKNQISRESIKWEPRWYVWIYGQIDRHDEASRCFSRLFQGYANMPKRTGNEDYVRIQKLWSETCTSF